MFQLALCPLCKRNKSHTRGCCTACFQTLFSPAIDENLLYLGLYTGGLEDAIWQLKYHHVTKIAKLFAHELANQIKLRNWELDTVTAVPLHWRRYMERGYNQAALIAKPLAQNLNLPYETNLQRIRYTKQQAKLKQAERQSNMENAFQAKNVKAKRILLVDDVITTGQTLFSCRDVLLKAGARQVKLATVAKAPYKTLRHFSD